MPSRFTILRKHVFYLKDITMFDFHPDKYAYYHKKQKEYLKKCVIKDIFTNLDIFQSVDYELVKKICEHIIKICQESGASKKNFVIENIDVLVNYYLDTEDEYNDFCVCASMENTPFLNVTIWHNGKEPLFLSKDYLFYQIFICFLKANRKCTEDELYMYNSLLAFIENSSLNEETFFYWMFWLYYEKSVDHKRNLFTSHIIKYEKYKQCLDKKSLSNSFYGNIMNWMNGEMLDAFSGEKRILNNIDHWEIFKVVGEIIDDINVYTKNLKIPNNSEDCIPEQLSPFLTKFKEIYDSVDSIFNQIVHNIAYEHTDFTTISTENINSVGDVILIIKKTVDTDWIDQENVITCTKEIIDDEIVIKMNIIEHHVFLDEDFLAFKYELLKCLAENN